MYSYTWDPETGGLLLNSKPLEFSKEPRPVYYQELDLLGFDKYWKYDKDDSAPYMWAEANNYIYRGKLVAQVKGGSVYDSPSIILISEPTAYGAPLEFVDIKGMIQANAELLESITQETIKKAYNTYLDYLHKVDFFHVSYSGGKDSEVALDIIQKALPHNAFVVLFGDTGMEYPDTYNAVDLIAQKCQELKIQFHIAKSHLKPSESWKLFGPPASTIRWCCSVHKTTPQLLKIREILGRESFTEMAFVGVRRDESAQRSGYDYISYGTKHKGQFSCNPILDWNSAEVFLYIYANKLHLNEAYKKGLARAGCLVCPMSSQRSINMRIRNYGENTLKYLGYIKEMNASDRNDEKRLYSYIDNIGWKSRRNGRDLTLSEKTYSEFFDKESLCIKFIDKNNQWKQWIKTIGDIVSLTDNQCVIDSKGTEYRLDISKDSATGQDIITIHNISSKDALEFSKKIRRVFRKAHYCVGCRVCEANCKFGNIKFEENSHLVISNNCIKCGMCLEGGSGCLVYKSLNLPTGTGNMKQSLDRYGTHAPKAEWFPQWIKLGDVFKTSHSLGNNEVPAFKKFLKDAGIAENEKDTQLGKLLRQYGVDSEFVWALMLVNLAYTPLVGWWLRSHKFSTIIEQKFLIEELSNTEGVSASGAKRIPNDLKRMSLLPFSTMGYGSVMGSGKTSGFMITRTPWRKPDEKVILYSLYKFAEACGDYYQFSLSRLMDDFIDSDGVSPAQIFGIDKESLEKILKGLAVNHPEFISVSFTLDLDNINLRNDKTSADVLQLF